jgi:Zn finger protein HypA/HybF involved in hydrogenase expression
MIIWGWRGREIEQERGQFHCPECNSSQEYKRVRVATYFTLYFIPLFETRHHGDYIECLSCNQQFNQAVLHYTPPSQAERIVASVRTDLESGTPLQEVPSTGV